MHVNDVGLWVEMVIPDIFQQHGTGDDLPAMAHQIFQQAEFPGLQAYHFAGATNLAGKDIHFQIRYF